MLLDCLEIRKTAQKGWGVFTKKDLPAHISIEFSPVIVMDAKEFALLNKTKLHDYIFHWEHDDCCMAMGYVPIYNHASPSNCEYFQHYHEKQIEIRTVRKIKKDEELTINYHGDANAKKELWFPLA